MGMTIAVYLMMYLIVNIEAATFPGQHCTTGEKFPYSKGSGLFYLCINGNTSIIKCFFGQYFNPNTKSCEPKKGPSFHHLVKKLWDKYQSDVYTAAPQRLVVKNHHINKSGSGKGENLLSQAYIESVAYLEAPMKLDSNMTTDFEFDSYLNLDSEPEQTE